MVDRLDAPRVVVGVHGTVTSLAALRAAVLEARHRMSVLVPVLVWSPVGGELAYRRAPCQELLKIWRTDAAQRLAVAFDEALGGVPRDLHFEAQLVRGTPGTALVDVASNPDDVLVIGSGHRRLRGRRLHGPTARYCMAHAACPVLLVPPPELLQEARSVVPRGKSPLPSPTLAPR